VTDRPDNIPLAVAIRLVSAASLAALNALVKLVEARGASLPEVLFFRQALSVPLVAAAVAVGPGLATLRTRRLPAHAVRMASGLTGMALLYLCVTRLPLAEATTLTFTVPIFATILGALWLGEPTGWRRWLAVGVGFSGVLVVVRPGGGSMDALGLAAGLAYGLTAAFVSIQLRQIGRTEGPLTTVFWFAALSVPVLAPVLLVMRPHPPLVWAMLGGVGVLGALTQVTLTGALRFGPVSAVVPIDYAGLIWASLFGWLAFGLLPTHATLLGAPLVVGSGLFIAWREQVRLRRAPGARAPTFPTASP
jgi:drug/metabolite transporter (DMT)-like permease